MATRQYRARTVSIQEPTSTATISARLSSAKYHDLKRFFDEMCVPDTNGRVQARTLLSQIHCWFDLHNLPHTLTDSTQLSKAIEVLKAASAINVEYSVDRNIRLYHLRCRNQAPVQNPAPSPAPAPVPVPTPAPALTPAPTPVQVPTEPGLSPEAVRRIDELTNQFRQELIQRVQTAAITVVTPQPTRGRVRLLSRSSDSVATEASAVSQPSQPAVPQNSTRSRSRTPVRTPPLIRPRTASNPNELNANNLDHLREFLRSRCQVDATGHLTAKEIIPLFNQWQQLRSQPVYSGGAQYFSTYLTKCGVASEQQRIRKVFHIRINPTA
jgi:hypothetical protein